MRKGKFIVLYGSNNVGKSIQMDELMIRLATAGIKAEPLKYPVYSLEPTGPRLNRIYRQHAEPELSELEIQRIFAQNRRDFEPYLRRTLFQKGIWIVAEDCTGTGIVWGMVRGVSLEELEEINADLLKEDLAILLDGERFSTDREIGHRNESKEELMRISRQKHLELAKRYGWHIVNANQTEEKVHEQIWQIVTKHFQL